MEKCKYSKDHLFSLNEIQRKTFEHYIKKKKNPCSICKNTKNVVNIVYVRQSKTMTKLSNLTGVFKCGSHYLKKENFYCNKCKISF